MKKIIINLFVICISVFCACNKFLDINPSTQSVNPSTIKDFQEMLNNDSLGTGYYFLVDFMSDDSRMVDAQSGIGSTIYSRTYHWNSIIWNASDTDMIYNSSYTRILQMNIILSRVNSAPKDSLNTEENRSNVISQALINRAWYYLQLANIYGPTYNQSTATTDLSVPLILEPSSSSLPARATLQTMYGQILADLKKAVSNTYLPSKGVDVLHPGKAAGYALLARTYLYEAQYDSAMAYADSSLALQNTLLNYNNTATQPIRLVDLSSNPEILLGRLSFDAGFYLTYTGTFSISQSLSDSLDASDLRLSKNFTSGSYKISYSTSPTSMVFDNSVGVPEVMLIKAECLARKGNVSDAGAILKELRSYRLKSSTVDTRVYNSSNILNCVLGERRRELYCHGGLRLFDLKRLNREEAFKKTIYRKNDSNEIIDSLVPGSNLYLFPFAATIIANNTNIVQNPR
ncbi:MAG: RagB/SusD family nutrient uptake outer membrane protein [Arachidicoccus sp.]|nr:RagB/SusD family nutrient uptake outer membrane protein [Arachidicoccus sp.]